MARISSLDQNPAKGGMPAMASQAIVNVPAVSGRYRRRLPMRRMSCSSCIPWMTEPEPRNRQALKKAWVTMWKMATQ
jgi:hypothetical protein